MQKESKVIKIDKNNYLNYYLYKPDKFKENLPVILFLHGIGERGTNISDIEKYSLPKYLKNIDIPFIVIAPQCLENNFWEYHLRDVEKIINIEYKKNKYDKENIFLAGSSMGAYGAWNYLIQRPDLFKGIISVAGGIMLPIKQNIEKVKNKKILMYHGDKDNVVDVNVSKKTYEKLKDGNAKDVELKIINNDNHFLTSHAFKDQYIYEWLEKKVKEK